MPYLFYYWPDIPGRGEFVRLFLEYTSTPYTDVARADDNGVDRMLAIIQDRESGKRPFAPPFLVDGNNNIAQTSNILQFLGSRHGLVPADEQQRPWVHQLQLTIGDFVDEIHDTHHPIGGELYYEDQKHEALRRSKHFLEYRLPKYLDYFESISRQNFNKQGYLVGKSISYVDLSMFQVMAGLSHAYPGTMQARQVDYPYLQRLSGNVQDDPNLQAYLASDRRPAFNQLGIFRYYPELDA